MKYAVNAIDFSGREAALPAILKEPTLIQETALQRLLIKKVHLNQGKDIGRGGALTNINFKVFINSNENSDNKELINVYDLKNMISYDSEDFRVPMNYSGLISSPLAEIEGFDLFRFRISGLYGEKNSDGTYTLFAAHNIYEEEKECISFNLSRIHISLDNGTITKLTDWETLFTANPCIYPQNANVAVTNPFPGHMAGGKIVNYDADNLLVSVGSFSIGIDNQVYLSADSTSSFGKFLLINKNTGQSSIYAIGIRNSQGLLISSSGTIWATEHGPQGGDELNIIKRGGHYGWPYVTYGVDYGNNPWELAEEQGRHDGFDKPAFVWITAIAPTNLIEITGEKFSDWKGDLIIGSLTGRSLHRVRIKEDNSVIYNEVIHLGYRVRDISLLPDERIIMLTDEGSLFIIDDGGPVYKEIDHESSARITKLDVFDILLDQIFSGNDSLPTGLSAENIYNMNCAACHYVEKLHDVGPHLNNLFNRAVGGLEDYNYSNVLDESDAVWTAELLKSFLLTPERTFPNTRMQKVPLNESEADSIVTFFSRISKDDN